MSLRILGLGTALPPHSMTQTEAADLARQVSTTTDEQATLLKVLYRRSGVGMRYTVLPHRMALEWVEPEQEPGGVQTVVQLGPTTQERMQFYAEHASPLALKASRTALAEAAVEAAAISHLVTVSCTGFAAPGVDLALINGLGLSPTVLRTHVGFMGCHGAINGLRVAQAFAAGDPQARILLCAVELCSLHYRFRWDPKRFIGNAIFADGAAAIVGGLREGDRIEEVSRANGHRPVGGERSEHDGGRASEPAWTVTATGSCLLPDSADAMTWTVGDHGFEMELSPRVPDLIKQHLVGWLADWLAGQHLTLDDVGSWAVHPGGPRILLAVQQALDLDASQLTVSREVLSEFGNMSSPTVLFILDRLRRRQAARPCVALAFGPGLVAEAALLT